MVDNESLLENRTFKFCFHHFFKTHSLKGIGGHFAINTPLNPLKIPLTQEDRFFQGVIA
ncbi:hypothetical protein Hac_1199 [Helicobacter acinonychis str. Sheeba]|uniref:Uncharacterized protein n=1 Tax=Helicobacter acinonychis (strain Sheeba) TaxID=382638 RepID=Q17WM1_HELAH|nr:hypothetical protein Hac_1199 [Helicobacter acinonychis str. Sheeba]